MHFLKTYFPAIFLGVMALAFQAGIYFSGVAIRPGDLADPDSYMRLIRVENLAATHEWYNQTLHRLDPPEGQQIHWSRPWDLVLLAGALPLSFFSSFHSALFWWSVASAPLLQFAALLVLFWTVRPFFNERQQMLCCLIFLCQPALINYCRAGFPDHHALLIFLFLAAAGTLIRSLLSEKGRMAALSGFLHAFALWVGVEGSVAAILALGTFYLLWIFCPSPQRTRLAVSWCGGLSAGLGMALAIEYPPTAWLSVQSDKVSLPYLYLGTAALFSWFLLWQGEKRKMIHTGALRSVLPVFLGIVSLLLCQTFFPDFFKGPLAQVDPEIITSWLKHIPEFEPLFASWRDIGKLMTWAFAAPFSLVFLYWAWRRKMIGKSMIPVVIYLSAGIAIYLALAFREMRWIAYGETILVIPFTAAAFQFQLWFEGSGSKRLSRWASPLVALTACAGFMPFLLIPHPPAFTGQSSDYPAPAPITDLAEAMEDLAPGLVFIHFDFGPELVYRSHFSVVSGPYHRSWRQIAFLDDVMNATEPGQAEKKLLEKGVRYLVLAPGSAEYAFYLRNNPGHSFYQQLLAGEVPSWLTPLSLPKGLEGYLLFEIREAGR